MARAESRFSGMAYLQGSMLVFLAATSVVVENSRLRLLQPWAYSQSTLQMVASDRVDWDLLFLGSSEVHNDIIPSSVDRALAKGGVGARSYNLGIFGSVAPTERLVYQIVRERHRPKVVVVGLAQRDLNASQPRNRLKLTVEAFGTVGDALRLASAQPMRLLVLPWYAIRRDVSAPLQAVFTKGPDFQRSLQDVMASRGGAWREDSLSPPTKPDVKWQRIRGLWNELSQFDSRDFSDSVISLIREVRSDGALPVVLVMPLSEWAEPQLPPSANEGFEAALSTIRDQGGVRVLRAIELRPELRAGRFYWDHVNHLAPEGARMLSDMVGEALAGEIKAALARSEGPTEQAARHPSQEP